MLVLEGVLVAMIILGAIYATSSLRSPETTPETGRRAIQTSAEDALVVLAGLRETRGSVLDIELAAAYDCRDGASPSTTGCQDETPSNLSLRLAGYLPVGAAYSFGLDNGVEIDELFAYDVAGGERVSASSAIVPDWNMTFVMVDLSCHESDMDVTSTLVPIWHGQAAQVTSAGVIYDEKEVAATAGATSGTWTAVAPPDAIGQDIAADFVSTSGTLNGTAATSSCDLGGLGWAIRDGLNLSVATALDAEDGSTSVAVGGTVGFAYDFGPIQTLAPGASITDVDVTIYRPLTARPHAPDAYVEAASVDLDAAWSGTGSWDVPRSSLFGTHPVVTRATLSVPDSMGGTTSVEARMLSLVTFALPNGIVPLDTPYRVVLEAWLPDWS